MNLDTPVSNLMTTAVACVEPNQKIIDLKHIYEKQQFHHHVPVTEDGVLIGIVSLIDFMRAIHDATLDDNEKVYHTLLVKDIMSTNPVTISEDTTVKNATQILSEGSFHSIIIAENNKIKGILTTADLLRFFLKN